MPRLTGGSPPCVPSGAERRGGGGNRDRRLAASFGPLPQRHDVPSPGRAAAGYAVLYTLVWKRRSPYGTIPGAVPGPLPVLIGYAAVNPRIGMDGVLLFLILLWQPPHFWALALRYQSEYRAAGVPSSRDVRRAVHQGADLPVRRGAAPLSLALWALGYLSARFGCAAFLLGAAFSRLLPGHRGDRRFGRAFAASIVYLTLLLLALLGDVLSGDPLLRYHGRAVSSTWNPRERSMSLLVVGSMAFDSIKSPFGEVERVIGGSATYFSSRRAIWRPCASSRSWEGTSRRARSTCSPPGGSTSWG